MRAARAQEDPRRRALDLARVAAAADHIPGDQGEDQAYEEAFDAALAIEDSRAKGKTLRSVFSYLLVSRDGEEAVALARRRTEGWVRSELLLHAAAQADDPSSAVARAWAREAVEVARAIPDPLRRSSALLATAQHWLSLQASEEALPLLGEVEALLLEVEEFWPPGVARFGPGTAVFAARRLVELYRDAGAQERAQAFLEQIEDERLRGQLAQLLDR